MHVQAPKIEKGPVVTSENGPAGSDSVQAAATALQPAAALVQ